MLRFVDQCSITTLLGTFTDFVYNSSNEAIKFFGSQRFLWVGRKGETKFYFRPRTCLQYIEYNAQVNNCMA
jgi:hypothetical protein